MQFSWDENKRAHNLEKHGLDLLNAGRLFDGRPVYIYSSPRKEEMRFVSVGLIEMTFVAGVWVERNGSVRLISLRRARDAEKRAYRDLHGGRD
jgi:uncharacterized DUF497 family protein